MPRNNDIGLENLTAAIAALAAGNGVFFGLGLGAVALTSWLRSRHAAQALEQVKSTPLTPLADVKSLFEVPSRDKRVLESDQARSSTADSPEDFSSSDTSASPRFAIVRGEVQPRAGWRFYGSQDELPLKSEFAPEEAPKCVLTRKTQTYGHVELDGSFRIKEAPMSDLLKQIPFVLRDSHARDTRVHVDWQGSPKDWLPLECVYRNFQPGAASGTQAFVFLVFGQSCPVGVVTEERVLKVGTELTAVGHMFKTGDGMSIRPAEGMPLFMTKMNKDEIVEALRVESLVHRWTGILTGVIAGSIFVYAAGRLCQRVYKEWRRRRNLYRNSRPPLNPAGNASQSAPQQQSVMASESVIADDADDIAPPGEACVICLTRTRRAVFLNCGHRAACFRCAQRVAEGQKICPLCRQAIVGVVRVYDP